MKSRASIKSHPLHPMLIPYPFAFLTGAFGFGVAGAVLRHRDLTMVSRYLVQTGVAAGVLAAVPGLLDLAESVPAESSARARATKHGLVNSTALLLFTAGWLAGRRSPRSPLSLALQGLGTAALSFGGWLGGTLSARSRRPGTAARTPAATPV